MSCEEVQPKKMGQNGTKPWTQQIFWEGLIQTAENDTLWLHCYSLLWKITTLTAKSTISMAIFKFANSNSLPGRVDHSSRNIQLDFPEPYPETFHRKLPASPALGPWALDRTGSI